MWKETPQKYLWKFIKDLLTYTLHQRFCWRSLWWEHNISSKQSGKQIKFFVLIIYRWQRFSTKNQESRQNGRGRKDVTWWTFLYQFWVTGQFLWRNRSKNTMGEEMIPNCLLTFFHLCLTSRNQSYSDRALIT